MTSEPQVIGLLGGMSWPSTITYYKALNHGAQQHLGGAHSARILLWSGDYANVERVQLEQRWDDAGQLLAEGARRLEAAGADVLAIACNTMHRVGAAVRSATALPLIDIVEATTIEARTRRSRCAGLLGTLSTIESTIYPTALDRAGIPTIVPADPDQKLLDHVIYEELCRGRLSPLSRRTLTDIADHLVDAGADTLILACTELGEAMADWRSDDVQVLDATQAHVTALLAVSLHPGNPA
ncbi:MAG: aspartate/glutamate racemase family protein [Dermatophilaceae bacterium]